MWKKILWYIAISVFTCLLCALIIKANNQPLLPDGRIHPMIAFCLMTLLFGGGLAAAFGAFEKDN